jgi:hypothetical protein
MPGQMILPVVFAATSARPGLLLQFPTATTQILVSVILALLIVFSVGCLRQSGTSRRWVGRFGARANRTNRARRPESARRDPQPAHAHKPPPGRDNSGGPTPV